MGRRKKGACSLLGAMVASIGLGMFLAFILPLYLTVSLIGFALICIGLSLMVRKR